MITSNPEVRLEAHPHHRDVPRESDPYWVFCLDQEPHPDATWVPSYREDLDLLRTHTEAELTSVAGTTGIPWSARWLGEVVSHLIGRKVRVISVLAGIDWHTFYPYQILGIEDDEESP